MEIRVEDLFYLYKSGDETVVALRGLHLLIESGECLVVRGPNGSGKSTLVKLLTGFLSPSAGRISIGGLDLSKIDPLHLRREYVSSIDQRGNLLPDLTVLENVALGFALVGNSLLKSQGLASGLLDSHGLGHVSKRYPGQLSAGERQMCSLLSAIATKPKILIADEPSGELDNVAASEVYELLRSTAGDTTVIMVTHDPRSESFADRVVRIRDGRISEEWAPGGTEISVVDPLGWMRVRDETPPNTLSPSNGNAYRVIKEEFLRAEHLHLRYGEKSVFAEVEVVGAGGELIALSSPSGTGKSSLLRILCGVQDPSVGAVHVKGRALKDMSREERAVLRKESISFLTQGDGPISNVSLSDHLGPVRPALFEDFGTRMNRPLSGFSGGERARIELLKILAQRKPILLLDEPTSQTDERRSREIVELLLDYVSGGALVVTSTRDEALLSRADRILTLGSGV